MGIKRLEGNPGKRRLKPVNNRPNLGVATRKKDRRPKGRTNYTNGTGLKGLKDTPACPHWLCKVAKNEWKRVVPVLSRLGLLKSVDRAALAGYCQAYARWEQAERVLDKGMIYQSKNGVQAIPQVFIAQKYLQICKAFCAEFGMTPSSRGRMFMGGEEDPEKEKDKNILD